MDAEGSQRADRKRGRTAPTPTRIGPPPVTPRSGRGQAGALVLGAAVLLVGLASLVAAVVDGGHASPAAAHPLVSSHAHPARSSPPTTVMTYATPATAASPMVVEPAVVSVRGADGGRLGAAGVVSFTSLSHRAGALILPGVSVLGGTVRAERIVVPDRGFRGARVEGLRVDGTPRAVAANAVYPLRGGGYVVALQEAVAGSRAGLVSLRIHVDTGLGVRADQGGDVLVGVPVTGSAAPSSVLALGTTPAPALGNGFAYPLAARGVVVGCPFVPGSTHSPSAPPDNLASDNAVDLAVPVGTPVIAVADGTIGSLIGPLDSEDPHLAGLRVHLDTATDHFYYAHLSRIDVHPGEQVTRGQQLGLSGQAAGVAHLHFAQDLGDPAQTVGEAGACVARPRPREPWG